MSSSYFKIQINVKPHVKKYMVTRYGGIVFINMKDFLSIALYNMLQQKNVPYRENNEIINERTSNLSDILLIFIPKRDAYDYGINIKPKNHLQINNFLEKLMFYEIFVYCRNCLDKNDSREKGVESFCKFYNLELHQDIILEAALKAEYRYRKKIEKKIENSPAVLSSLLNKPEKSFFVI